MSYTACISWHTYRNTLTSELSFTTPSTKNIDRYHRLSLQLARAAALMYLSDVAVVKMARHAQRLGMRRSLATRLRGMTMRMMTTTMRRLLAVLDYLITALRGHIIITNIITSTLSRQSLARTVSLDCRPRAPKLRVTSSQFQDRIYGDMRRRTANPAAPMQTSNVQKH